MVKRKKLIPSDLTVSEFFGMVIKLVRLRQNLSLQDVASITGVSASTIAMIERGKNQNRVATYQRIFDGLGIDVFTMFNAELIGGDPSPSGAATVADEPDHEAGAEWEEAAADEEIEEALERDRLDPSDSGAATVADEADHEAGAEWEEAAADEEIEEAPERDRRD